MFFFAYDCYGVQVNAYCQSLPQFNLLLLVPSTIDFAWFGRIAGELRKLVLVNINTIAHENAMVYLYM